MKKLSIILLCLLVLPGCWTTKTKTVLVEEDNTVRHVTDERPIKNEALIIETGKTEVREDTLIGKYIIGPALYKKLVKASLNNAEVAPSK